VRPGQIIRERRLANGITQQQLAIRAGSTQAAISRLERGEISPTFHTFELLLTVMGEEPTVTVRRSEAEYDRARLRSLRARPPAERLAQAIGWNLLAGRFAQEGRRARASADSPTRGISEPTPPGS
jgi:transcriptional regulator with XRE-family HTH domain